MAEKVTVNKIHLKRLFTLESVEAKCVRRNLVGKNNSKSAQQNQTIYGKIMSKLLKDVPLIASWDEYI